MSFIRTVRLSESFDQFWVGEDGDAVDAGLTDVEDGDAVRLVVQPDGGSGLTVGGRRLHPPFAWTADWWLPQRGPPCRKGH